MKALITGASSGIGRDFARVLSEQGVDLILVARRKDRLQELKKELKTNVDIIALDLASSFNCSKLFNKVEKEKIDILINNAGFGVFGKFNKTKLETELDMIDVNIKATHILTKLFLADFKKRKKGYILNVASAAAFQPGPFMASYYASKSYIYNLTCAIYDELRREDSNVSVSVLCPGPVNTEFNKVAGVKFKMGALESYDVATYAVEQMYKEKLLIIPSFKMKTAKFLGRFLSVKMLAKIAGNFQEKKKK